MTPIERLQAAIEKFELHADESWHASDPNALDGDLKRDILASNPGGGRPLTEWPLAGEDALLIETLHRTIDAQLAILRHELARAHAKIVGGGVERAVWSSARDALALADAILGSDS